MAALDTWNYMRRRLGITGSALGIPSAANARMRISVSGGVVTSTSGAAYPAGLVNKTIEVWGAGGAGTLIDEGDGYDFEPSTGALTGMGDGTYLILIYT